MDIAGASSALFLGQWCRLAGIGIDQICHPNDLNMDEVTTDRSSEMERRADNYAGDVSVVNERRAPPHRPAPGCLRFTLST